MPAVVDPGLMYAMSARFGKFNPEQCGGMKSQTQSTGLLAYSPSRALCTRMVEGIGTGLPDKNIESFVDVPLAP